MTASLIVVAVLALVVVIGIAARAQRRAFIRRVQEAVQSAGQAGDGADGALTIDLGPAMRDGLAQAGLSPDAVRIQTRIQTTAGRTEVTMADAGPDYIDLSRLGVAEVQSISALSGQRVATLELDAIGEPKRCVTADLTDDQPLQRGDRVYVLQDSVKPDLVSLAPPALTGGATLPPGTNRLDAQVLGPEILRAGTRGRGLVKAVGLVAMADPSLAERGFSKWRLEIEVSPEQGFPYRAELTTALSTPQKAAAIAHVGAEVPVRYDPRDPKTIAIDSIAMGFGDPYEQLSARAQPFASR